MEPLSGNEAIQQFMKLLEENNRTGQAADLSQLMGYMDYMDRQYDAVLQELREVRAQLAQEKQPAVQRVMKDVAARLGNRVKLAQKMLAIFQERIVDCSRNAVENFKQAGVSALDTAVAIMDVKPRLESLQEYISSVIADTKRNIEAVENAGQELRSAGGHLRNAGRALTGREAQTVEVGQEGRFQSAVLAPMRGVQKLLVGMNNATLAAIGGVEHLEQITVELRGTQAERETRRPGRRLAKKPSIRQALAEKRAEVAAQPVSAPEKEHKPPEAAL